MLMVSWNCRLQFWLSILKKYTIKAQAIVQSVTADSSRLMKGAMLVAKAAPRNN